MQEIWKFSLNRGCAALKNLLGEPSAAFQKDKGRFPAHEPLQQQDSDMHRCPPGRSPCSDPGIGHICIYFLLMILLGGTQIPLSPLFLFDTNDPHPWYRLFPDSPTVPQMVTLLS